MTDDEQPRNECYPSAPPVAFRPTKAQGKARRAFIDRRNAGIQHVGAARAIAAADGDSIGAAKKAKAARP